LKPLTGRIARNDESHECHLAPESLRPIFLRVLTDCLVREAGLAASATLNAFTDAVISPILTATP
jgi:hypothetical protein